MPYSITGILEFFHNYTFQDLKNILDSAEHGVIYFSLGSVVKSSEMPRETVSLLLSELAKLKQTVLWKWEDDRSCYNKNSNRNNVQINY